CQRGSNWPLTF
nr:immunoglobulin light chain junction region [Macaca mulatta]